MQVLPNPAIKKPKRKPNTKLKKRTRKKEAVPKERMSHTIKTRGDFQPQNPRNQFPGPEVDQSHFQRTKRRNSRNRSLFPTSGRIIIRSKRK